MHLQYDRIRDHVHRILIIKLRAIGDVILATPVIENLRRAFPEAQIDFLTEKPSAPLLKHHPDLDEVVVFERGYVDSLSGFSWLRENARFFRELHQRDYDLVFDLFGNPRSAQFTWATRARYRIGFAFRGRKYAYNYRITPRGDRVHEVQFNLDALQAIGVPVHTQELRVQLSDIEEAFADRYWQESGLADELVIGLNGSGGWYTKRWPLQKFAALGDRLVEQLQCRIMLFWGPGELQDAQEIARLMRHEPIMAPQTDLLELAALLKRLHLLVSNDSGPMHLAAAVGTPVVGLFGPTRPELQGPWGEGHHVVQLEGLPCLGCNKTTCEIQTLDCMTKLEVEPVLQVTLHALELQRDLP